MLSYLVGRVSIIRLFPFSLREFMDARGQKELTPQIAERMVWEHATYGGYPKVVTVEGTELKKTVLRDLYETMLLKDVARTFSIEDGQSLEQLAKYIAVNTGCLLSYESLSKHVGLSFHTLKKYLEAMEKSYLITRLSPFFTNKGKEITKQPKAYFVDTSMRNAVAGSFSPELDGKLFENYVLTELLKLGFSPKYWRSKSGAGVDFVVERDGKAVVPVEAKLKADPGEVSRSMRAFINAYSPEKALVVSYKGRKGSAQAGSCRVVYTTADELSKELAD